MISLHEALASVDRVMAKHRVEAEALSTVVAMGRILAADQRSKVDLPPFNKSAMDGYAVMEDDRRDEYRILETVAAGEVPTRPLEVGAATKVMTGAPVPVGSGRVIMVEDTDGGSEIVCVREHRAATNICCQGEDIRVGQVIMKAGAKLTPVRAANLVACGVECVAVSRRIRVAIYATGDEIVDAFEDLVPGKIMNENGPMLEGLCRQNDLEVTLSERVPDNRAVLKDALEKAAAEADMILMSGGVSAGDFDFVPAAMADAGFALHFDSVAVQPGKPVTFATRGRHVVLGMPGNPVSVFITFHLYARRIAAWLSGAQPPCARYLSKWLRK